MSYQFGHPETKPVGTSGAGPLFQGKRCLITGASSGIGFGLAQRLLQRGAKEVWICSQNENRIRAVGEQLGAEYPGVHWKQVDITDEAAISQYLDEMAAGGEIDYVFANAGVSSINRFTESTDEDYRRLLEVNLFGVIHTIRAALPHLLRQGRGRVLTVSSMEGFFANGYHSAYVTSKFALFGLTESLRYEFADRNILFSVICPGPVRSNIWGRDAGGNVHPEFKGPSEALTETEAADEILAGIEEGREVILVTDTARTAWLKHRDAPESANRWAGKYTQANLATLNYLQSRKQ